MTEYNRDTVWRTYDGREIPFKDLEDNHILNLTNYMKRRLETSKNKMDAVDPEENDILFEIRSLRYKTNLRLLEIVNEEVKIRNLDISKVADGKSLPYKNEKGEWMIWKKGDPAPTKIPNSIDFIKPLGEEK